MTPARMVEAVAAAARALLIGRRITVRAGQHAVRLRLAHVEASAGSLAALTGQLEALHLAAEDLQWADRRLHRLSATSARPHVRLGVGTVTLGAAPVTVEAVVAAGDLQSWAGERARRVALTIGDDGVLQARSARRPRLWCFCFALHAAGDADLRVLPRALMLLDRRLPLGRLPARSVRVAEVPPGFVFTEVHVQPGQLRVCGVLPQWRRTVSAATPADLLRRIRSGQTELELPGDTVLDEYGENSEAAPQDADNRGG